jgi:hypothetical protein
MQAIATKSPVSTNGIAFDPTVATVSVAPQTPSTSKPLSPNFDPKVSVERATEDDTNLVKQERAYYVQEFKRGAEKSARSTLEMCRVVYEAHKMLDAYQFQNFCSEVGYKDTSSTIRKFIAIGKVYPRFIQYADQMPNAWTAIYQITQIPAAAFDAMIKRGQRLSDLRGKLLKEYLEMTAPMDRVTAPLKYDSENGGYEFAKLVAMRQLDDVDWRAIEKGLSELSARLPVKFVIPKKFTDAIDRRRVRRYEAAKTDYKNREFSPETWDMGEEANKVLPRKQDEAVSK